jgi:hypothetical protein
MKKVLFLMILPFLLLGTARVSAQVRIGGSGSPHSSAVLDLNADNETTPSGNRGGLALPRVALTENNMQLNGVPPVNGMLVYHTGSTLDGAGVYVWMTDKWVKTSNGSVAYTGSTSIALDDGSFKRKALTGDVTADENSNATVIVDDAVTSAKIKDGTIIGLDIAPNEIQGSHLADNTVTGSKIATMDAVAGNTLTFDGQTWVAADPSSSTSATQGGKFVSLTREDGKYFPSSSTELSYPVGCRTGSGSNNALRPVAMIMRGSTVAGIMDGAMVGHKNDTICGYRKACQCLFLTF